MKSSQGWKKGDILYSKPGMFLAQQKLIYLADSKLDKSRFIAEDAVGEVADDWKIDNFEKRTK